MYVVPFLTTSDDVASVNADTDVLRMPKPTATTPLLSVTEAVNEGRALEVVVSPDSEIVGAAVSIVKVAVAVWLVLPARSWVTAWNSYFPSGRAASSSPNVAEAEVVVPTGSAIASVTGVTGRT